MTEFHADDYGLFPAQSKRILDCFDNGVLNGTSVMPNSEFLPECLKLLPDAGLSLSVHLNLMEGRCVAPKEDLDLLVNEDGVFSVSFLRLLLCGLTGKRERYKHQLKRELRAQIQALLPLFAQLGQPLRLDGHAHWHMLPVVFDALMEVIAEDGLDIRYIRIPREPLSLYLRHFFHIFPFHPINIVKTLLLHILSSRNLRRHGTYLRTLEQRIFLGVLFSGCFDYEKFRLLLPDAEALARARGCGLELLAHPGAVYEPEDIAELTNRDDLHFLTSPARQLEAEAYRKLKEDLCHAQ